MWYLLEKSSTRASFLRIILFSSANSRSTNFAFSHHPIIDTIYPYVVTDRFIKYPTKKINVPLCALWSDKGIGTFHFHLFVVVFKVVSNLKNWGRAIAQAVSRWLPTTAVRGSKPDLGMWDLWWDKVALGRFSQSSSVSPAIVVRSTNYSTITLMYHPGNVQ
jgi:hypothetical protein